MSDRTGSTRFPRLPSRRERDGFSLLEVILALAILTGSMAVLGEVARQGIENARVSRFLTQAQLLCESKMEEIAIGLEPMETMSDGSFDSESGLDPDLDYSSVYESNEPAWLYSVEVIAISDDGLTAVQVIVYQDLPEEQRPVQFALSRWFIDPTATESAEVY